MKYLMILLTLLTSGLLFSANDVSRMETELSKKEYPEVLNLLYNISAHYYIIDDSVKFSDFAIKALMLTESHNDTKKKIDALNNYAYVISYRDRKKASELAKQALELAGKVSYNDGKALAFFMQGYSVEQKDIEVSFEFYTQALNLATSLNYTEVIAMSEGVIGDYYTNKGSIANALKHYINAIKIYEKIDNLNNNLRLKYLYGELLNSLGISYKKLKNYNEAVTYYEKYSKVSEELNNPWGLSIALNNLAVIYYNRNDYKHAISNFNSARQIFEKIGAVSLIPTIDNNLGNIYSTLGDYKKSEDYYKSALNQYKTQQYKIGIARSMTNLGDLYLQLKRYSESKTMFQSAIDEVGDKDLEILAGSYSGLSSLHDSLRQFESAYKYLKIYSKLKDSLNKITKSEEIVLLTQRYKDEKLIEERDRLKAEEEKRISDENRRKNNLEYMGILIVILFGFAFIFFYGKWKISPTRLESIVFVAILFLFTFISVMTDPYVDKISNSDPLYKLIINAVLALALTPLDTFLEKIIRLKVIDKR